MPTVTIQQFARKKERGEKIRMMTCYDATFARLLDASGIDGVLVGDSLGNVIQGHENTLPVTVDDIVYHTRAVTRACSRAHVVADLPFGSYQVSTEQGVRNAVRLVQEGRAQAVKLEGGERVAETIGRIVQMGIPVMGHLGFTPQSVHGLGGYRVQGREEPAADRLLVDARALVAAGVYAIVLEMVPAALAARVTRELPVPTIGIGAGRDCDGQILVLYDFLGLDARFNPKFLKKYRDYATDVGAAFAEYCADVDAGRFPADEQSFT
jgi:3-methyl-2-oxobutanoate hydroxymethyltransferase